MSKLNGLTNRQRVFCKLYSKGMARKDAMIQAGYSPNGAAVQASRLLSKPMIKEYLTSLDNKIILTSEYTRQDIVAELLDISTLAKGSEEYHAAIRANELLGKDIGMFKQELQVSGAVGVVFIGEDKLED